MLAGLKPKDLEDKELVEMMRTTIENFN